MNDRDQMTLLQREEEYLKQHPITGKTDLRIIQAYWGGTPVSVIAMDIPCSETTVYRAIRRVRNYLKTRDPFYEVLRDHVQEHPPCYGDDAESILEMLFCQYEDYNPIDTAAIKEAYHQLYGHLDGLSLPDCDAIIDTACILCHEHVKAGFVEGIKVGVRMGVEFYSRKGECL